MKLKYQLVVSFLIIVIFPCILLALIAFTYRSNNGQIADYVIRAARFDEGQKALIDIAISIAIILFFTAAILIIWIYKSIISKINRLIYGAQNIIDGNLNFTIQTSGTDELSLLINTFEDMKERLRKDADNDFIALIPVAV